MALRVRNGVRERQQADGSWALADGPDDKAAEKVAAAASDMGVDQGALDAALKGLDFSTGLEESFETSDDAALIESLKVSSEVFTEPSVSTPTDSEPSAPAASAGEAAGGIVDDIPGLTSDDGQRGTGGSRRIRERLISRGRGRIGPKTRRDTGSHIRVPGKNAEVSGPAADDTTLVRVKRSRSVPVRSRNGNAGSGETVRTRYVSSAVPALLKDRPRWVQELFEAHFRADSTLAMRRVITGYTADGKPKNRMKLSREDFAIGWLTAFDKFREDSRVLRLRGEEQLSRD